MTRSMNLPTDHKRMTADRDFVFKNCFTDDFINCIVSTNIFAHAKCNTLSVY